MKFKQKERIALFGTSADPPTIGHEKILTELSQIFSCTITYASNNPNKKHKEEMSIRSLLLKTLIKELKNPKIIFNQKISSQWAIESIKNCKKFYKLNSLDFVIGSDLISDIFSWKNFEISILKIPNISSSMVRLDKNYSNLPKSLIDIVKKNNFYVSTKLVE